VSAGGDFQHVGVVEHGLAVIPLARENGPAGEHVELGEEVGRLRERLDLKTGAVERGSDIGRERVAMVHSANLTGRPDGRKWDRSFSAQ
jgi:hypothetical protein